jgi:NADH dehydrogenase
VVVTGADGQVGRALLASLKTADARTIALTRGAVELPADTVVCGSLQSPAAAAAIRSADYVVHLAGALRPARGDSYESANLLATEAVAEALRDSLVKRVLFLSYVGAREGDENVYLRLKAAAERSLVESGKDVVVFRSTHIIGAPDAPGPTASALIARPGLKPFVLGSGRQIVAPVYRDDVVRALAAALTRGVPGVYELAGPERMSMDELVRLLNRDPGIAIVHVPDWLARLLGMLLPSLPGPMVEVLLGDSVGDSTAAVDAFGLALTPLSSVWAAAGSGSEASLPR